MSGTWIPESERDTRWYIFKKLWLCSVPVFESRSIEDIQNFGVPASGDSLYDESMRSERAQRMLSIDAMVEFYKRGVQVAVVNYTDTKLIYERISDHLNAWKTKLEDGWHTRNAPIEDLMLLDKFAMVVYKHARHQFTTEMVDSILARRMSGALRVSRDKIMGDGPKVMVINQDPVTGEEKREEEEKLPERTSMADVFASHAAIASGGPRWSIPNKADGNEAPNPELTRGAHKWK